MTKLSGSSYNSQEELLQLLQAKFPEVFTEGKVDPQKLKATLGESINTDNERYGLNWAGKSDCFRHIQEPVTATLKPCQKESVDFGKTENLFIEGDNLEVLKVMQKSYYGKVKMIYTDPPYNTGNDSFIYPDKFEETQEEYLERVGEKEEGQLMKDGMFQQNSKENGHYHSNWISMMYPRLFLARNLMRDDGVIFVSIDDNEVHNLRMIMNEVFGEENFVGQVIWERAYAPINLKHHFSESHDFVLCYAKNITVLEKFTLTRSAEADSRYKNPDNDPRGDWKSDNFSVGPANPKNIYEIISPSGRKVLPPSGRSWVFSEEKTKELIADNRVWFGENGTNVPSYKRFLSEVKKGVTPMTVWKYGEVGHSQDATKEVKSLFDGVAYFDYPKPTGLIRRMLDLCTKEDDLVLDFFSGSGTTAHAVMALNVEDGGNRKCISVQLPEVCEEESEAAKAGYRTIADIAKERIRRAGKKIYQEVTSGVGNGKGGGFGMGSGSGAGNGDGSGGENEKPVIDTGFKVFKLDESNFKIWRGDVNTEESLKAQLEMFVDNVKKESTQENVLYELILKSGLDLNISAEKKTVDGKDYFVLGQGELIVCLADELSQKLIDEILAKKPQKIVVLDKGFQNDDQLKTNTLLQAEDEGVEFKVI